MRRTMITLLLIAFTLLATSCEPVYLHAPWVASWSPDGGRVALASFPFDHPTDLPSESGIWILEVSSGKSRRILELHDGRLIGHLQWSPYDETLLFLTVETEGNDLKKGDHVPFSVWTIGVDGRNLRKVADGSAKSEDDLVVKNFVAWGPMPETVIYADFKDGKIAAIMLDLKSRETTNILPAPATAYALEFSPSRDKAALLSYGEKSDEADLYVANSGGSVNWRFVGVVQAGNAFGHNDTQRIHWSPDGSKFLIFEDGPACCAARVYDPWTGGSVQVSAEEPNTGVVWSADARSFFYSGNDGIFRVDVQTQKTTQLVRGEKIRLMSLNAADGRLYFFQTVKDGEADGSEETYYHNIYSCLPDGADLRVGDSRLRTGDWLWERSPTGTDILFMTDHSPATLLNLRP